MPSSWKKQFFSSFKRNLIVKKRDHSFCMQQVFIPMYIMSLLLLLKLFQTIEDFESVPMQADVDPICNSIEIGNPSPCWKFPQKLPHKSILAYVPNGNVALDEVMEKALTEIKELYTIMPKLIPKSFETEQTFLNFYNFNPKKIYAAIIFENIINNSSQLPQELKFKIRINGSNIANTRQKISKKSDCRPPGFGEKFLSSCPAQTYLTSGFVVLQTSIAHAIVSSSLSPSPPDPSSSSSSSSFSSSSSSLPSSCSLISIPRYTHYSQLPLPPYKSYFSEQFQLFFAIYFVFALGPILQIVTTELAKEKENLIKDSMILMGMNESIYWISHFLSYSVFAFLSTLILIIFSKMTKLFSFSSFLALFFIFYSYLLSLVALGFVLSTIFSRTAIVSVIGYILTALGSFFVFAVHFLPLPPYLCYLLAFFSPFSFSMSMDIISKLERNGEGMKWSRFYSHMDGINSDDYQLPHPLSMAEIISFLLFDIFLYLFLAWHLNAISNPDRLRKRKKKFHFFVFCKKCCLNFLKFYYYQEIKHEEKKIVLENVLKEDESENNIGEIFEENPNIEKISPKISKNSAIVLKNLNKIFFSPKQKLFCSKKKLFCPQNFFFKFFQRSQNPVDRKQNNKILTDENINISINKNKNMNGNDNDGDFYDDKGGGDIDDGDDDDEDDEKEKEKNEAIYILNNINISIYENQCLAIMGNNEFAKNSLINILCSISSPNSGDIFVYGHKLKESSSFLKSLLGFCPSQNICHPSLSVRQQLSFFSAIKGKLSGSGRLVSAISDLTRVSASEDEPNPDRMADAMMEELGIQSLADVAGKDLLPGQQRLVSIAIALINEPRILIFDNPIQDLDPYFTKKVLNAFKKRIQGRIFIFSTKKIFEAEFFSARILFLSQNGKIKFCGNSLFLKNRLNLSYFLHIQTKLNFHFAKVFCLIQKHFPCVTLLPTQNRQKKFVLFKLPSTNQSQISNLIEELTINCETFGIENIFLELMNIEDVLEIENESDDETNSTRKSQTKSKFEKSQIKSKCFQFKNNFEIKNENKFLFFFQFLVIFKNRFVLFKRNYSLIFRVFGFPLLFTFLCLIVQSMNEQTQPPELILSNSVNFGTSVPILYSVSKKSQTVWAKQILNFLGQNHRLLDMKKMKKRFVTDFEISKTNSMGSNLIGIHFEDLDLNVCVAKYSIYYPAWHVHYLPSITAMIDNIILKIIQRNVTASWKFPSSFTISNHPLPFHGYELPFQILFYSLIFSLSLLFIPSVLISQILIEKNGGNKLLLSISGLNPFSYWFGNFVFDYFLSLPSSFLTCFVFFCLRLSPLVWNSFPWLIIILLLSMLSLTSFSYFHSLFMPHSNFSFFYTILSLSSLAILPHSFFSSSPFLFSPSSPFPSSFQILFILFDPPYTILSLFHYIAEIAIDFKQKANFQEVSKEIPWKILFLSDTTIHSHLLGLVLTSVLYFLLVLMVDVKLFSMKSSEEKEEKGVGGEERGEEGNGIMIKRLEGKWKEKERKKKEKEEEKEEGDIELSLMHHEDVIGFTSKDDDNDNDYVNDYVDDDGDDDEDEKEEENDDDDDNKDDDDDDNDNNNNNNNGCPDSSKEGKEIKHSTFCSSNKKKRKKGDGERMRLKTFRGRRKGRGGGKGNGSRSGGEGEREGIRIKTFHGKRKGIGIGRGEGEGETEGKGYENERRGEELEMSENFDSTMHYDDDNDDDGDDDNVIVCEDVVKCFDSQNCFYTFNSENCALKNISFKVKRGEIFVLLGSNQSGKSCVLKILSKRMKQNKGKILINNLYHEDFKNSKNIFSLINYLPQDEVLYPNSTVKENLELFYAIRGQRNYFISNQNQILDSYNLLNEMNCRVELCASDTLRQLSFAISSVEMKEVWLMDEPTNRMNPEVKKRFWDWIKSQPSNQTILMTTKCPEEAEQLATRVGVMVDGGLRCSGTVPYLKKHYGSTYTLQVYAPAHRMPSIRAFIAVRFSSSSKIENDETEQIAAVDLASTSSVPAIRVNNDDVADSDRILSLDSTDEIDLEKAQWSFDCDFLIQERFQITINGMNELAKLLCELEEEKDGLGLIDYSVSQPTLRTVFTRLCQRDWN